jgi:hypothetical protein
MGNLISILAIAISFLAIFINQWVTFIPALGIAFQYHKRRYQIGIAILAIMLVSFTYLLQPIWPQLIVLIIVIFLIPLSGFNNAAKFLIPVDRPRHVPASQAAWPDHTRVLAYRTAENIPMAWSLDTLIPHHIINDSIIGKNLLVGW